MSDKPNPTYTDLMTAYEVQRARAIFYGCLLHVFTEGVSSNFVINSDLIWLYDVIIDNQPYDLLWAQKWLVNHTMIVEHDTLKLVQETPPAILFQWTREQMREEEIKIEKELEAMTKKPIPTES